MKDEKWIGVHARCDKSLLEKIDKEADKKGKRRSKTIVRLLEIALGNETANIDLDPIIEELKALRLSLVPIGGNMNQIAHNFNVHQIINRDELKENHQILIRHLKKIVIEIRGLERELYKRNR